MTKPKRITRAKQTANSSRETRDSAHQNRMYSTSRHKPFMDGSKISHRQVVMNLESAATYASSIHPTNTTLFPWLAAIAGNFEEYRFNHCRFEFIGYAASTTGGPVVMAIDLDANDAIPNTVAGMNTQTVAKQGSGWDKFHVALPSTSRRWRLCEFASPTASTNASAANLVSCGNWLAVTDTSAPAASAIGFLAVDYEVEFRHPTASIPQLMAGEGGRINDFRVTGLVSGSQPVVYEYNDAYDSSMKIDASNHSAGAPTVVVESSSMAQYVSSWFQIPGFTTGSAVTTTATHLPLSNACEAHELSYGQGRSDNSSTTAGTVAQIVPTLNAASGLVNGLVKLFDLYDTMGGATDYSFDYKAFEGMHAGIGWYDAVETWAKFKVRFNLKRFDAVVTVQTVERMHAHLKSAAIANRDAAIVVRPTKDSTEPIVGVHKDGAFAYGQVQLGSMCAAPTFQTSDRMHCTELFHKAWTRSDVETPSSL